MADIYCDDDLLDYTGLTCGVEKGRITGLGLVLPSSPLTNPADNAEWVTNTGASPQTAWVIVDQVRGELPRATDTEEEGFGNDATQLSGAEHTASLQIKGMKGNEAFTNIVNKKKWHVALAYSNGDMFYVDVPCTVIFRPTLPDDLKSTGFWDVVIKWSSIDNPTIYTTPTILQAS